MSKSCFSTRDRCNFNSFDHWKVYLLLLHKYAIFMKTRLCMKSSIEPDKVKKLFSTQDRCNFNSFDHWKCIGLLAVITQIRYFHENKALYQEQY